jgi:hypothetical protein
LRRIDLSSPHGAIFSEDRCFRYALWRVWDTVRPLLMFIGLNPSDADERRNDPTITRLVERARRWGYGGLLGGNLHGYVTPDPHALRPYWLTVGLLTDEYLREMVTLSSEQLCGWGSFRAVRERAPAVYPMLKRPVCLGLNTDGEPKHPLYLSYERGLEPYVRKTP